MQTNFLKKKSSRVTRWWGNVSLFDTWFLKKPQGRPEVPTVRKIRLGQAAAFLKTQRGGGEQDITVVLGTTLANFSHFTRSQIHAKKKKEWIYFPHSPESGKIPPLAWVRGWLSVAFICFADTRAFYNTHITGCSFESPVSFGETCVRANEASFTHCNELIARETMSVGCSQPWLAPCCSPPCLHAVSPRKTR